MKEETSILKLILKLILGVSDNAKDSMIEPVIPTTFAIANNQVSCILTLKRTQIYHEVTKPIILKASKLGLQHNKSIISVYDQYQVIQLDQTPLIITLIADTSANTGNINLYNYKFIFY